MGAAAVCLRVVFFSSSLPCGLIITQFRRSTWSLKTGEAFLVGLFFKHKTRCINRRDVNRPSCWFGQKVGAWGYSPTTPNFIDITRLLSTSWSKHPRRKLASFLVLKVKHWICIEWPLSSLYTKGKTFQWESDSFTINKAENPKQHLNWWRAVPIQFCDQFCQSFSQSKLSNVIWSFFKIGKVLDQGAGHWDHYFFHFNLLMSTKKK